MAWQMSGKLVEACSCKMMCRCLLGPTEPDQGWCSAMQSIEIVRGSSDGVDLSGTRLAIGMQLPGDFFGGVDLARLYIDEGASAGQRLELEAIFTGKKGGVWEALRDVIKKWLPTQVTSVKINSGDNPSFSIAGVGGTTLQRLKTEDGHQAVLTNAPVAAAFQIDSIELASAERTRWADPDMREWETAGFGAVEPFSWKA